MSLAVKLMTGFITVAILTGTVGILGWYGISGLDSNLMEMGNNTLPAISALIEMEVEVVSMDQHLDYLACPYLSREEVKELFKTYDESIKTFDENYNHYKPLHKEVEEEQLWQVYVKSHETAEKANNQVMEFYKKLFEAGTPVELIAKPYFEYKTEIRQDEISHQAADDLVTLQHWALKYYGETHNKDELEHADRMVLLILIVAIVSFIAALVIGIFLSRSISRPINQVTGDLFSSAQSLEGAANQVSSSGQELSSGASELASSVEEMTSSLEELQSIIESNTKTVSQAKILMGDANKGAKDSGVKMTELGVAIGEITDNSRQIERIIKVIDDIAFQTNILALNAAVEAARAGDAGRGFAVVADQVKNLAQKSAEAAKETAGLIAKAIDSVQKGELLGNTVAEAAQKSGDLMDKVDQLMDEVARASQEQLKGANQVTKAVGQINSVTQQTASSAEETAAAGEEILGQSGMMRQVVEGLNSLVKGESKGGSQNREIENKALHLEAPKNSARPVHTVTLHQEDHEGVEIIRPEDQIPMDDFKDF